MPDRTTASSIMRRELITVKPEMSVMEAVHILLSNQFSGAPVVDDEGNLVGIMSELDCVDHMTKSQMSGTPPQNVEDLMTRDVITVPPETTLLQLVDIFGERRFRRLPVVNSKGRLMGQISRRDLMKALYDKMKVERAQERGPLYLSAVLDKAPAKVVR